MKVRKLDSDGDMTFGENSLNFWQNVPDAVAQCVVTRLRLQYGEWFLDTSDGTDWRTKILGKFTNDTRDLTIQSRTLGTQGCKEILAYSSALDRNTRRWSVDATIDTIYGKAVVKGPI